ncbi:MAG: hypothetical protein HZB67_01805 [Candidatus Aenigmarchaeota archaeon]|nr:hypothetical protein [Candidatus Aenigmarchaeota archaeon]
MKKINKAIAIAGAIALLLSSGNSPAKPSAQKASIVSNQKINYSKMKKEKRAEIRITDYLSAIEKENYKAAYEMLSSDSKKMHSYSEFVAENKKGRTIYDLKTLTITKSEKGLAGVLYLYEDPACTSIHLKEESNSYRIIWHKGIPTFPYTNDQINQFEKAKNEK